MTEHFLPFDENSFLNRSIYHKMKFWEKIIVRFFTFFRKDFLPDYFTNIGMQQLDAELGLDPIAWYSSEGKELTTKFAQDLHDFIKALAVIVPILRDTTGSPSLREKSQSAKLPLIERVFCDLWGSSHSDYPFGEKAIFKMVNNVPIREVDGIIRKALSEYLGSLTDEEIKEADASYSRLVSLDRTLSISTMDFLRRFNINVNLSDTFTWDTLSIAASSYYLESFYQSIMALNLNDSDFSILPALQATRSIYNPEALPVEEDTLRTAWNEITNFAALYKNNDRILNFLRLSHKNLSYEPELTEVYFSIFEKFRSSLEERLKAVTQNVTRNSLKHEMKQLVQDILPSSLYSSDLTDVGVFNAANSDHIQASINESLRNVYAMSLLQVFIVKFYKPWVKSFLGSCAVNAQFNQSEARSQLNSTYKNLNKLTESFDKFAAEVHPKSSMGQRITKLLDNPKMNRSDKHLLKVFTDSLNNQADLLVKEFYTNFPNLFWFVSRLTADLDNNTSGFVANILSVKSLQDSELPSRLHDLKSFSTSVMDLLNITFPKDQEEHIPVKISVPEE